uniref:NADH dehydrogenase subunit 4L n=1 Tax=Eurytoma acutibialis TaxID=3102739 RepID=UPI002E7A909C|nr:NADH dehydrogenase subunit 4L [Eurytoma acutibialis]WPS67062.1 NADH dehydrogenase subunit 4L [Eurytoma acutibialis]
MMFFFSMFMMCYMYSQILMTLLSMEFLMLSILLTLSYNLLINNMLYLLMYYLVFVVCEGVLGLTLLVSLIRNNGNDNMNFLNLILW